MEVATLKQIVVNLEMAPNPKNPDSEDQPRMTPFTDCETLRCPWLHWAMERHRQRNQEIALKSVLLLQDWDVEPQTLAKAVSYLNDCESGVIAARDNTIRNLFSQKRAWKSGIIDGEILVTNAAWGIRPGPSQGSSSGMCGYLGADIHKRSFLTWGLLISRLLKERESSEDFRLFVAGDWATFDQLKGSAEWDLKDYMHLWCTWVTKHRGRVPTEEIQPILDLEKHWAGKVTFLRHPCVWHTSIKFEQSPF